MDDLFDHADKQQEQPPSKTTEVVPKVNLQVDPRLLAKALKKMQGLVRGNGIKTEDVTLSSDPADTNVKMYRFRARTFLKLANEYGVKTEAGRNTKGELMPTQVEFNRALAQTIMDVRTIPEKRKQLIDFMFARTDKGFGIKDQRVKFHFLTRDFVQHEKCLTCKNTGQVRCAKCQGHGVKPCINCQGRRQIVCPRCRGTTKIHTPKGIIPCQHCRADGKINCPKCAGRGQQKCQACAASGTLQCQPCAGSGWLSHMAHIETYAQIFFDFDKENLPPLLIELIEQQAGKLVEKNDIEVALTKGWSKQEKTIARGDTISSTTKDTDNEPDDMVWLDYDAMCPYGPITFMLKNKPLSANLFGFQARLNDCPPFLESLTKIGRQSLVDAATGRGDVAGKVHKAAKYAILRDIITQTLRLKNPIKTQHLLITKYTAGMRAETFLELVTAADLSIRNITRKPRIVGMCVGMALYTTLTATYLIGNIRHTLNIPTHSLWVMDVLLPVLGMTMGILTAKMAALWSQKNALHGIIPDDILRKTLPKAGTITLWSIGLSVAVYVMILAISWTTNTAPEWLIHFIGQRQV